MEASGRIVRRWDMRVNKNLNYYEFSRPHLVL